MPTAEIRRAFEMIGRMTAAWNDVDLLWELIFTCMLHEPPRATTDVLLQQFPTSARKRQMIVAVANVTFTEGSFERGEIEALSTLTTDLGRQRNATSHGWYILDPLNSRLGLRIAPGANPTKPNRLAREQLDEALPRLLAQLVALCERLDKFRLHLAHNWLPPDKSMPTSPIPAEMLERVRRDFAEHAAQHRAERGWPPFPE